MGSSGGAPTPPPHPASYMEVLEMLEKGQTPPGIRVSELVQASTACLCFLPSELPHACRMSCLLRSWRGACVFAHPAGPLP